MASDFLSNMPILPNPALIATDLQINMQKLAHADVMYEKIMNQIYEYEQKLKPNEEIGAYLTSFGKEIIIQIEKVGYQNPYLIIFNGKNTADSSDVQLVQHVSQVNLLFVSIKLVEERKPMRIGFQIDSEKPKKKKTTKE